MARKISMIDLAGIGNLLEYLVAADNITCEERDRIILRIAKENDIAEYTLSALAGYGKSKSEVLESVARRKNSVSQDKKQDESYISLILGGPFGKTITAYIGQQHSLAEISIEQFGERIITVHTVEDASIYDLHHLYFDLKRLIMLMDGQFYPITSVTQDGVEITTSIQKKLLPNYFSADFMIGENNRLINFDEVLSETLFSNWCLIQEELDIVHNTALYCLSRVEMPVDMKCAFLIEAFIGVGEIIQSKKSEFVLPKRKSREESQLGLDLKYIISHYGQEIFRGEYQKDLEGFVQILVNSRNRIAHIKSKQNRKFLNGDESVLYLHKLSLMYRIILLDLLDIPLNRYKERLSNRIETINCWWADRCDQ